VSGGAPAAWEKSSTNAVWRFYNANEDTARRTAWYLEIESADVDMLASESAELQVDLQQRTATFYDAENKSVCRIIFPDLELCQHFSDEYHNKLYENITTQGDLDLGNATDWFYRPADTEPMDWEETKEEELPKTPRLWKDSEETVQDKQVVKAVAMGAGENSFLIQEGRIGVLKNEYGAVTDTGRGFALTPPRTSGMGSSESSFTPSKVMLMQDVIAQVREPFFSAIVRHNNTHIAAC
jgi:hypothetical protein